jgi:hypothetical protein
MKFRLAPAFIAAAGLAPPPGSNLPHLSPLDVTT